MRGALPSLPHILTLCVVLSYEDFYLHIPKKQRDDSSLTKREIDILIWLYAIYRNVIFNRFIQFLTFVGK